MSADPIISDLCSWRDTLKGFAQPCSAQDRYRIPNLIGSRQSSRASHRSRSTNRFRTEHAFVNVGDIDCLARGADIGIDELS